MGLWRVDDKPIRLLPGGMPTEARLEELIEAEPTILGEPLLIIGRQVATSVARARLGNMPLVKRTCPS
jgi:hypothetical protein